MNETTALPWFAIEERDGKLFVRVDGTEMEIGPSQPLFVYNEAGTILAKYELRDGVIVVDSEATALELQVPGFGAALRGDVPVGPAVGAPGAPPTTVEIVAGEPRPPEAVPPETGTARPTQEVPSPPPTTTELAGRDGAVLTPEISAYDEAGVAPPPPAEIVPEFSTADGAPAEGTAPAEPAAEGSAAPPEVVTPDAGAPQIAPEFSTSEDAAAPGVASGEVAPDIVIPGEPSGPARPGERRATRRKRVEKKKKASPVVAAINGAVLLMLIGAIVYYAFLNKPKATVIRSDEEVKDSEIVTDGARGQQSALLADGWKVFPENAAWFKQEDDLIRSGKCMGDATAIKKSIEIPTDKVTTLSAKIALDGSRQVFFGIESKEAPAFGVGLKAGLPAGAVGQGVDPGGGIIFQSWTGKTVREPGQILDRHWYRVSIKLDPIQSVCYLYANDKQLAKYPGMPLPPFQLSFQVKTGKGYLKELQVKSE